MKLETGKIIKQKVFADCKIVIYQICKGTIVLLCLSNDGEIIKSKSYFIGDVKSAERQTLKNILKEFNDWKHIKYIFGKFTEDDEDILMLRRLNS